MLTVEIKKKLKIKIQAIRKRDAVARLRKQQLHKKRKFPKRRKFKIPKKFIANFRMRHVKKNIYVKNHYKNVLLLKQSLRFFYGGVRNSKFRQIQKTVKNLKTREKRINVFFSLLERRLPLILLRMNLIPTIVMGLQGILHGYVKVNGNLVTYPGFLVKPGDLIEMDVSRYKKTKFLIRRRFIPNHLAISKYYPAGIFLYVPEIFELQLPRRYKLRVLKYFVDNFK